MTNCFMHCKVIRRNTVYKNEWLWIVSPFLLERQRHKVRQALRISFLYKQWTHIIEHNWTFHFEKIKWWKENFWKAWKVCIAGSRYTLDKRKDFDRQKLLNLAETISVNFLYQKIILCILNPRGKSNLVEFENKYFEVECYEIMMQLCLLNTSSSLVYFVCLFLLFLFVFSNSGV